MTTEERKKVFLKAYKNLVESGGFLKMLHYRAKGSLSRFSLNNITLIMWQAAITDQPMPTVLHTYKDWQKLGRQVQRDEHGWYVFGPHTKKKKNEDGEEEEVFTGYHIVHEFDISQTEGEPYHEPAPAIESSDYVEMLDTVVAAVKDDVPVKWQVIKGGAKGWYSPDAHEIVLKAGMSPDEQLSVLIHELIHEQGVDYKKYERKDAEMIAETAAAIVCLGFGLDTLSQATDYVAWWAGQDPERAIGVLEKAENEARTLEEKLGLRAKRKPRKVAA